LDKEELDKGELHNADKACFDKGEMPAEMPAAMPDKASPVLRPAPTTQAPAAV
jgi:hypothetical protein